MKLNSPITRIAAITIATVAVAGSAVGYQLLKPAAPIGSAADPTPQALQQLTSQSGQAPAASATSPLQPAATQAAIDAQGGAAVQPAAQSTLPDTAVTATTTTPAATPLDPTLPTQPVTNPQSGGTPMGGSLTIPTLPSGSPVYDCPAGSTGAVAHNLNLQGEYCPPINLRL